MYTHIIIINSLDLSLTTSLSPSTTQHAVSLSVGQAEGRTKIKTHETNAATISGKTAAAQKRTATSLSCKQQVSEVFYKCKF